MRIQVLLLLALPLFACDRIDDQALNISISNVTVGLMRKGDDGSWRVYSRGNTFPLRPNGSCVVAEKSLGCMWYGVEFDYSPDSAKATLACTEEFSKQTDLVTAERLDAPKTDTTSFEVPLKSLNGHVALPAAVFREPGDSPAPWTVDVRCRHHGRELLRYTFTALHEA
jgi:hypothetical protein